MMTHITSRALWMIILTARRTAESSSDPRYWPSEAPVRRAGASPVGSSTESAVPAGQAARMGRRRGGWSHFPGGAAGGTELFQISLANRHVPSG